MNIGSESHCFLLELQSILFTLYDTEARAARYVLYKHAITSGVASVNASTLCLPNLFIYLYRVIQILCAHTDSCRSRPWLARCPLSGPSYWRCFQTLTLLLQVIFRVDGHVHDVHLQSRSVSVYWVWLLLDVSTVSVVIVIITICDMPRQEFSLRGRVYIHNTYMKAQSRVLKHDANFE